MAVENRRLARDRSVLGVCLPGDVVTTDTDALIQTVREALWVNHADGRRKGETALDSLAARLTEYERQTPAWDRLAAQEVRRLEAELERVKRDAESLNARLLIERSDALAELERVKAERDGALRWRTEIANTAAEFEARLDKALTALRWYADVLHANGSSGDLARKTIAEIEGETWACACVGPPAYDGDPRCVCAREAARSGKPWPRWEHLPPPAEIEGEV